MHRYKMALMAAFLFISFRAFGQDVTGDLMTQADELYRNRANGAAEQAVKLYEKILAINPEDYDAYWKLGKAYMWLGDQQELDSEKTPFYKEGVEYCKLAVELHPDRAEAHFWLGALYGLYAKSKGILQGLYLLPHIQKEFNITLKMKPDFEQAGPYRALGRMYYLLPTFKGGDMQKSESYLRKAVELAPSNLMNHRYLAETLIALKRIDEARQVLAKVLQLPLDPDWKSESELEKKLAKGLLEEIR